jgi:hypothetical protein
MGINDPIQGTTFGEDDNDSEVEENDDADDSDDCSVLSEISGLTDAWNLAKSSSSGHRPRNKTVISSSKSRLPHLFSKPSPVSLHSPSAILSPPDSKSLVGSHVSTGDTRSVTSRRSKSSFSSGGSTNNNKVTPAGNRSVRTKASSAGASSRQRSSNGLPPKVVTFSTVRVRQYERILCDNPAASSGLAIGIGWKYSEEANAVPVEEWQLTRRKGRTQSDLLLSRRQRDELVRMLGYADHEVAAMRRELNKSRANRRQTVNNLGAQRVEEAVESVKSKVKSVLFLH